MEEDIKMKTFSQHIVAIFLTLGIASGVNADLPNKIAGLERVTQ